MDSSEKGICTSIAQSSQQKLQQKTEGGVGRSARFVVLSKIYGVFDLVFLTCMRLGWSILNVEYLSIMSEFPVHSTKLRVWLPVP